MASAAFQITENYADLDTASNSCRQTFSKFESCTGTEDKFGPKNMITDKCHRGRLTDRPVYDTTRCLLDLVARPNTNGALCYSHDDLEKESMINENTDLMIFSSISIKTDCH